MDYIHCHQCYRRFSPDRLFFITSCGHIFCSKCSPKTQLPKCPTCSLPNVQAVPINKQMPANVAVYFTQNLVEEQNLLIRKYEFQLFQFKHLYKHLSSEKSYDTVCRQIDKNLSEFKRCTTYLKLPKCALLTHKKTSTQGNRQLISPSQQNQRETKVQPHLKQLPYLPSPVGSSFSGSSRMQNSINREQIMRHGSPTRHVNDSRRGCQSQPQHNMNDSICSQSSSNRSISSPALHRTEMPSSRHAVVPVQRTTNAQQVIQSQFPRSRPPSSQQISCRINSSPQFNSRPGASPQFNSRPRPSPQFNSRPGPSPQFNSRPMISPQPQTRARILNSNGGSHKQNQRYQGANTLQRTESSSSILSKMSTTPSLNTSQSSLWSHNSNRSRVHPTDQIRVNQSGNRVQVEQRERGNTSLDMTHTSERISNQYSPAHKTNLLQMQRALVNPRPGYHAPQDQIFMKQIGDRMINRKQNDNDKGRRSAVGRSNNSQDEMRLDRYVGGQKDLRSSPFTQYRLKPQSSPGSIDTPPLSRPSSSEKKSREQNRLVSPRTSSSLSSSNSHSRQEVPYRRPQGSELRTPTYSPNNKQPTPPPFQETLKLLTAAVRKSNI